MSFFSSSDHWEERDLAWHLVAGQVSVCKPMDKRVTTQASCYFDFLGKTVDPVCLMKEIKEKLGDEKEKFQDNKAWLGEQLVSNIVRQDPCRARAPSFDVFFDATHKCSWQNDNARHAGREMVAPRLRTQK